MKLVRFGRFALAVSGLAMAVAMPAHADVTNTFATQSSITVVPTTVESIARAASVSASGSNVTVTGLGSISGTGAVTAPVATGVVNAGSAFTYSASAASQDAPAAVTITSGTTGATPAYSTQNIQVGGVAGTATVTALSSGLGTAVIGTAVGTTVSTLQQASLSVFK